MFRVGFPAKQTGCERLSGAFLEAASAEGEGRTGGGEPREAEPPGRLSGGRSPARGRLRTRLQRRRLPAGGLEPQQPRRCRSPLGGCACGPRPFSACLLQSPSGRGPRASTGSFPAVGEAEGKSGQDLAASATKGAQRVKCPLGVAAK